MDNENFTNILEGMRYALLVLAEIPENKFSNLLYHVARDIAGDRITIIYLWRTSDGVVAIGDMTHNHGGKFLRPSIEFLGETAARLKMIKSD